jgi:hypothetical protein
MHQSGKSKQKIRFRRLRLIMQELTDNLRSFHSETTRKVRLQGQQIVAKLIIAPVIISLAFT